MRAIPGVRSQPVNRPAQVYWAGEVERFPEGGKMSQYLESLTVGDHIEVKGPLGHFSYLGRGRCAHQKPKTLNFHPIYRRVVVGVGGGEGRGGLNPKP